MKKGWKILLCVLAFFMLADLGYRAFFYRPTELLKVPYMKDRYANIHGFGDDAFITRGYVYDKYVGEDGGHYVDLICWCEDLDGNIGQEIPATVRLPSRQDV